MPNVGGLIPEETVRYKTYLKESLVLSLRDVFANHPDPRLNGTRVHIDFPTDRADYPSIIVRYFGRDVKNAGVSHIEWIKGVRESQPDAWTRFKHYLYDGTVEFAIYAISSIDRDLLSDTLVQIIGLGDLEGWTNNFFNRLYHQSVDADEVYDEDGEITDEGYSLYHYVNVNTDNIQEFGENQTAAPWGPEDQMIYQTAHRIEVFGEFYSLPPDQDYGLIEHVHTFPWIRGIDEEPTGNEEDAASWLSEDDSFGTYQT